jgi:hypothetical protein
MSNHAAPPKWVESVPYHDLRGMHGFARQWRDRHRGRDGENPRRAIIGVSSFCEEK